MDVIRHDDEVEHLVAITVEVQQAVGDEVCDLGLREDTRAVTGVECFMPAGGEAVVVFDHQVGRKFLDPHLPAFLRGIDALGVEPTIAICLPAILNILWHGISRAPGDEDHGAVLRPVRQLALSDEQIVVRIEEMHAAIL